MEAEKDWLTLGFGRQKRGLIIMSVILLFLRYSEPNFSDASLRLFQIHFGKPEVIWIALWAIFGFFVFRWFQYFYHKGTPDVWSGFTNDFVQFAWCRREKLYGWVCKLADEKNVSGDIFNFKSKYHPSFYIYHSFNESGGEIHLLANSVEGQDNVAGTFQAPLKMVLWPIYRAALRTVFMRPMFIEEFFPMLLATITIILYLM